MKSTLLITSLAALGLAITPLHATDAVTEQTVEKAVAKTATVYIVTVSGEG